MSKPPVEELKSSSLFEENFVSLGTTQQRNKCNERFLVQHSIMQETKTTKFITLLIASSFFLQPQIR